MAQSTRVPETFTLTTGTAKDEDELKPLHPKDVKPPPEFGGARKDFLPWHESFTSMLRSRSTKWTKVVGWLTARREKRLQDDRAKADFVEYQSTREPDEYIEKNFELFSKHLYGYLLDNTKDQARIEVMANKEVGVFETYRSIRHKGINVNDENLLDVEAKVLNPRRAKNEKEIPGAIREWRTNQAWLVEAGSKHTHEMLKIDKGRMAKTILIKMLPSDGRNPVQRYLRENLAKFEYYDDLEEELHKELYRREAETEKTGGINQVEEIEGEKVKGAEWEEEVWQDVWSPDYGWVQALENKRPRDGEEEGNPEAKVRKGDGKANKGGKGKGKDGKG